LLIAHVAAAALLILQNNILSFLGDILPSCVLNIFLVNHLRLIVHDPIAWLVTGPALIMLLVTIHFQTDFVDDFIDCFQFFGTGLLNCEIHVLIELVAVVRLCVVHGFQVYLLFHVDRLVRDDARQFVGRSYRAGLRPRGRLCLVMQLVLHSGAHRVENCVRLRDLYEVHVFVGETHVAARLATQHHLGVNRLTHCWRLCWVTGRPQLRCVNSCHRRTTSKIPEWVQLVVLTGSRWRIRLELLLGSELFLVLDSFMAAHVKSIVWLLLLVG
jgi:hypothetical protein